MIKIVFLLVCALAVANSTDWWEQATLYQIYPRTFKDADNDGVGDLKGVTSKLTYLKEIGLTAAWLSPIFKSPQVDAGYDVSDYRTIDPTYGNLEDLRELIDKAHELGLKIILDFVPNHTSDQHEWFIKSLNGDPEYADFYIWRKGKNNNTEPPCNWKSLFKGVAWKYMKERDLWYYHLFTEQQPELNYRNPKVMQALNDIMLYWLDFGVDGFRIDAVPYLLESEELLDEPKLNNGTDEWFNYDHIYTKDIKENFEPIYQWRELMDKYNQEHDGDTRIMMTEAYSSFADTMRYYGSDDGKRLGAHFTFNFEFVGLSKDSSSKDIKKSIDQWLDNLPKKFVHNWVAGNHDNPRIATRFGKDNVDAVSMLQAILPGIMVNYNGEEYGMENGPVSCEEGQDSQAVQDCDTYAQKSRDFERTPMQWDNSTNAGFNEGAKPWLPVNPNYVENNIKFQSLPGTVSYLNTYKDLQELRKQIPDHALTSTVVVEETVLVIARSAPHGVFLYLYNKNGEEKTIYLNGDSTVMIASSISDKHKKEIVSDEIDLKTNEAVILYHPYPQ